MSERFPGGFVTMTPPSTTGGTSGTAPGVWTVDQAMQKVQDGVWPQQPVLGVEDVFSTFLYPGTGSAQTFNNGIDFATKGGLVWIKGRSTAWNHTLYDTNQGVANGPLVTNDNSAPNAANNQRVTAFNANGFSIGTNGNVNTSGENFVSWSFRKQAKFFDVLTYTGTGVARTIAHNLGSVPGCIIIKKISGIGQWSVYHRSTGSGQFGVLNLTNAFTTTGASAYWNSTTPTSTEFSLGTNANVNENGSTFVAYLFAHNAGGFGTAGTDNVITCGTYTGASATVTVDLGWEPQWVLIKRASGGTGAWAVLDNMRGVGPLDATNTTVANVLYPNTSGIDVNAGSSNFGISATGFSAGSGWGDGNAAAGSTYIYIAIRRGPMKTPTSGSTVYGNNITTSSSPEFAFPVDLVINSNRSGSSYMNWWADRLRGSGRLLVSSDTTAESSASFMVFNQGGKQNAFGNGWGVPGYINWGMRRAPGFMDVVCYTGTGSARTVTHNLGVAPELIITKSRTSANNWGVYHVATGNTKAFYLSSNGAPITSVAFWNDTSPTSSVFTVGTSSATNSPANDNFVAYLFASCPGVSKVGSFTQVAGVDTAVNCGFTSGARFILIKSTATTSNDDWYVWDSTRGITSSTDPYLRLNLINAEVTTANAIVPNASGFTTSGGWWSAGTYIYLAIA